MDKLPYHRLLPILCAGLAGILLAFVFFGRPAFSALTDQELEERYTQARQAFFALEKSPKKFHHLAAPDRSIPRFMLSPRPLGRKGHVCHDLLPSSSVAPGIRSDLSLTISRAL
jgi:hypothetical protein